MNETQTHFVASCPYCSTQLRIRRVFAGQQVQCKHCNETFVAKETDGPSASASGELDPVRPLPPLSQPERVVVSCPSCQAALSIRRAYLGRQVRCKQCDETFVASDSAASMDLSQEARRDRNGKDTEHAALQAEVDRQKMEANRAREELDRTRTELEAIRAQLGEIVPAAVRPLFEERASLLAEIDRLRDEVQVFRDQKSPRDRTAEERDRQWEGERIAARAEVDRLAGLLEQVKADLEDARAEQDRLGTERQHAADEADQLRATLAEREHADREEGNRLRDEADQLRIDRDRRQAEAEDLLRSLDDLEQNHCEELARRDEQLRQDGEQVQEREAILAERDRLRSEIQDLQRVFDDTEQRRRYEIDRLDAELAAAMEQRRQLQERHEAAEQSCKELRARNQELQVDLDRFRSTLPTPAADDELQAAHAEIAALKRKLDLADRLQREMSGILGGMGIRVRQI